MSTQNRNSKFKWIRSFVFLFLVGLLLSTGSAFAQTQSQDSNSFAKHLPENGVRNQNPTGTADIEPLAVTNLLLDPSFEAYTPNPSWSEFSTNFGTPLCTVIDCGGGLGTAGPRTGSVWGWFGGVDFTDPLVVSPEIGDLSQDVTIPNGYAILQFYFWIGNAESGSDANDYFSVGMDGAEVFSADATQIASYPAYTLVSVDVSSYADGFVHTVDFYSDTSDQLVTFNLDDVALLPYTDRLFLPLILR